MQCNLFTELFIMKTMAISIRIRRKGDCRKCWLCWKRHSRVRRKPSFQFMSSLHADSNTSFVIWISAVLSMNVIHATKATSHDARSLTEASQAVDLHFHRKLRAHMNHEWAYELIHLRVKPTFSKQSVGVSLRNQMM